MHHQGKVQTRMATSESVLATTWRFLRYLKRKLNLLEIFLQKLNFDYNEVQET